MIALTAALLLAAVPAGSRPGAPPVSDPVPPALPDGSPSPRDELQPVAKPEPREELIAAATAVKMWSGAKAVEDDLSALGKPDVSFRWCNRAGCVDKGGERGSNRMSVQWRRTEGGKFYFLTVTFCTEPLGAWQVAMVSVTGVSETPGAFGTMAKPEVLHREIDLGVPGCMAEP